jgi:hypothetical protein
MSLLDYAPRESARTEEPEDVRLHLRFADQQASRFLLAALCIVGMSVLVSVTLTDPDFPRPGVHLHGRGAGWILLLLLLPLAVRAVLLWSITGTLGLALIVRARRMADRRVDYIIGRRGITDIGLFHTRHFDWRQIRRVVLIDQRRSGWFRKPTKPGAIFAVFDTGMDAGVSGAIPRASHSLFVRRRITIPLRFVGVEAAAMKRIVRRFRPAVPIEEKICYV